MLVPGHDVGYVHSWIDLAYTATSIRTFQNVPDGNDDPTDVWQSVAIQPQPLRGELGGQDDFTLLDEGGNTLVFHSPWSNVAARGRLKTFIDPGGQATNLEYDAEGRVVLMYREEDTTEEDTVRESYVFTYEHDVEQTTEPGFAFIESVTLKRTINSESPQDVRKVTYEYYESLDPNGNQGDLKTATVTDAADHVVGVEYYRYYVEDNENNSDGYIGGLKYRFSAESFERLSAAMSAISTTPFEAEDAEVAPYADNYFEYDGNQSVTKEVAGGQGCSACTDGMGAFEFAYFGAGVTNDTNVWSYRTTVKLPDKTPDNSADNDTETVYSNYLGETVLKIFHEYSTGKEWREAWVYDDMGRVLIHANPSAVSETLAVSSIGNTGADLLEYDSYTGDYANLKDDEGLIERFSYYDATTADDETPGGVEGYLHRVFLQNGDGGGTGPTVKQAEYEYIANSDTGVIVYALASETIYTANDGTGALVTNYNYDWFADTARVESTTVTHPIVGTGQLGPNSAEVETTFFDIDGRPIWTKDADGHINYTEYDFTTGAVLKHVIDVNTSQTGDFDNKPDGWTNADGLHLVAAFGVDILGRETKRTDPEGNVTYTVYDDVVEGDHAREVRVYRGWDEIGETTTGPVIVYREDWSNADASYSETLLMIPDTITASNGVPTGEEAIADATVLSDVRDYFNNVGQHVRTDKYFEIPSGSWTASATYGTVNTHFYQTDLVYDAGQLTRIQLPTDTITRTIYDGLKRPTAVWVGTNDEPEEGNWSPDNNDGTSNMVLVAEYEYDNDAGDGDGNLTKITRHVSESSGEDRVTEQSFDWRNRLFCVKEGVQTTETTDVQRPMTFFGYDNLDHLTVQALFDGDDQPIGDGVPDVGLKRAASVFSYDNRGRLYFVTTYEYNQSTGAQSTYALYTKYWHDGRGNLIKVVEPGKPVQEYVYDGAGRLATTYTSDGAGGTTWTDAIEADGDRVVTQVENQHDGNGNIILTVVRERFHDAADSLKGGLGDPASTSPVAAARVSYTGYWYDAIDRVTDVAEFGTNGGTLDDAGSGDDLDADDDTIADRPAAVPTRSNKVLVTSYDYSDRGCLELVTDPKEIVTKTICDALGRTVTTIEAYDDGDASLTGSKNRTTEYTYDGSDHLLTITARLPDGDDVNSDPDFQTTQYLYTRPGTDTISTIHSNDLLWGVRYPTKSGGSAGVPSESADDNEVFTLNAAGQRTTFTDRNGTEHTYAYDVIGRMTEDKITDLDGDVDGRVRLITFGYDGGGRANLFSMYSSTAGGSGNLLSEVSRTYNGLGQLLFESQDDVSSGEGEVLGVTYTYHTITHDDNHSRLEKITYPNGRIVRYEYGNDTLNDRISRLAYIADDSSGSPGTHLEDYSYLGLSTIVELRHPEAALKLTYVAQSGDTLAGANSANDGGDKYVGLDRFGRIVDQWWIKYNTGNQAVVATNDRFQYAYDRNGNRLYKDNLVDSTFDELYHANAAASGDNASGYDKLNRLTNFRRGTLSASTFNGGILDTVTTLNTTPGSQKLWALDALGNWTSSTTDGSSTSRTHNSQNQIATVASDTLNYDDNGNMILSEEGDVLKYDAWNRLVGVYQDSGNRLGTYRYDALGRRIAETNFDRLGGVMHTLNGSGLATDSFVIDTDSNGDLEISRNGGTPTIIGDDADAEVRLYFGTSTATSTTLTISAGNVHLVNDGSDFDALTVNITGADTDVQIVSDTQHMQSLSISAGTVKLQEGLKPVLVIGSSVSISSGGKLDLTDGDLIVRQNGSLGTWGGSAYTGITGLIADGHNGGTWDGTGIMSSAAMDNGYTAVGVTAGEALGVTGTDTILFHGQTVDGTTTLVKFTYGGDANLSGNVDVDDYGQIDFGAGTLHGYYNGDFTYDGVIDVDDYGVIDFVVNIQAKGALEPYTRHLYYTDQWQVAEERLGSALDVQYVWSPRYVDAMALRDRDSNGDGSLDQRHYAQQDANFNVTAVVDASTDAVVERYLYDPYGTPTVIDDDWSSDDNGKSDTGWVHLHQGLRYSPQSGLYSVRYRDYDAELGRWAQQDPMGYVDGSNLYQYLISAPLANVDGLGLTVVNPLRPEGGSGGGPGTSFPPPLPKEDSKPKTDGWWNTIARRWSCLRAVMQGHNGEVTYDLKTDRYKPVPFLGTAVTFPVWALPGRPLGGFGNVGGGAISTDEVLLGAERWLGPNYRQLAPGVYRSGCGTRQFRMIDSNLLRTPPHVNFEAIGENGRTIIENSHVLIID